MQQDGVEIFNRFYPWPTKFRLGDPVLVREVTGMDWPDFVRAMNAQEDEEAPDQVVLAGLIAVAFWQGNPQMTREKARRTVERVPQDKVEIVEGDEGGDDGPPAEAAGEPLSTSSTTSDVSPEGSA